MACSSYGTPFCSRFADGKTCSSALDAGCDPTSHPGRINNDDAMTFYELVDIAAGWADACPAASASTCTTGISRVECVVWDAQVACGRPFLEVGEAGGMKALQAGVVLAGDGGSDWIGTGGF